MNSSPATAVKSERGFEKPVPPGIHVILGDSAAGTFRRVFQPGDQLLIDRDVLSCGPTLHCADLRTWSEMRHAYWSSVVPGSGIEGVPTEYGLLNEIERLRSAERITIWASTGVSEQLFIAHVIQRAEQRGVDPAKLHIVQFTMRNHVARCIGVGELGPRQMSEHPDAVPIAVESIRDYRAAWAALTSPDPAALERFGERNPNANEWLKRAMQLLLRRFPDQRSGLPWWDEKLLAEVGTQGRKAARIVGATITNHWDEGDPVGDMYLFGRLLRLGDTVKLPAPLIEIRGNRANMRECEMTLTPFGQEVLEGRASYYPTNPIDDWASGVKLSSANGTLHWV